MHNLFCLLTVIFTSYGQANDLIKFKVPENTKHLELYEQTLGFLNQFQNIVLEQDGQEALEATMDSSPQFGVFQKSLRRRLESEIEDPAERKAALEMYDCSMSALEQHTFLAGVKTSGYGNYLDSDKKFEDFVVESLMFNPITDTSSENSTDFWPVTNRKLFDEWTKGSAHKEIYYHGTKFEAAQSITSQGFRLDKRRQGKIFGNAVYLTSSYNDAQEFADGIFSAGSQGIVLSVGVKLRKLFDHSLEHPKVKFSREPDPDSFKLLAEKMGERENFEDYLKKQVLKAAILGKFSRLQKLKSDEIGESKRAILDYLKRDKLLALVDFLREQKNLEDNFTFRREAHAEAFLLILKNKGYDAWNIPELKYLIVWDPRKLTILR